MAENVSNVDFGKERRESMRRFERLADLIERREAEILADPLGSYASACEAASRHAMVIREARRALQPPVFAYDDGPLVPPDFETLRVPRDEWDRLRACAAIVRKAMGHTR